MRVVKSSDRSYDMSYHSHLNQVGDRDTFFQGRIFMKASFTQALANLHPDVAPVLLSEFDQHMVGVVRMTTSDGFWEQHNDGDEILIILQGRMDFTLCYPNATATLAVEAGDILHIPQGVAHGAKIYEEVHILFFTPQVGNISWVEGEQVTEQVAARHRQH
ncbi:cupin domain-containing protein [Gloeocapsopsis sp. IPPAS B-1203]|uniref:cupin domain-containing protein n=1 Tax=Gloeocapsopsis sp. IPPAS B-1203 TaxID=2049454 RepID=UPI000C5A7CA0|nr:cupin domain-containing protein [Gloeocapsopsis sp. IPPAS B-1203]PIG92257.1 hypothetical protein CSQ79_16615 [Gloeocapsopsis sp. IPPAS B-1203]